MKKSQAGILVLIVIFLASMIPSIGMAGTPTKGKRANSGSQKLAKALVDRVDYFDGNRVNNRMRNNGQYVDYGFTSSSGFEWPKGTLNFMDYAAGIWVAGKNSGEVYTAAAEYASEFAAGKILSDGTPDDESLPKYKWWKISRADLTTPTSDYLNWPFEDGAPALRNSDNTADSLNASGQRIPGLAGDMTMWCVFNDASSSNHGPLYATDPMGIEMQMTVWGYNRPDAFGDMFFVKSKIINKSSRTYDSAFVALWDDPDLGDAGDDYVGCDTALSLGYVYNGDNNDASYGSAPPAMGRDFFQGPIVPSVGDTAFVSGKRIPGYKNLPMYAFAFYTNSATYPEGDPEDGTEAYNYLTGHFQDGSDFIDANTNQPTRFAFAGDPVAGTGWTELTPTVRAVGDRRFLMSCGPFSFNAGDTQEVVFGVMVARGSSNLGSISALKNADKSAQIAYELNFKLPPSPPAVPVIVSAMDREIILHWDNSVEDYTATDRIDLDTSGNSTEYVFEGYIVYQVNAASGFTQSKRLAVYDIAGNNVTSIKDFVYDNDRGEIIEVTSVKGTDGGIKRTFRTETDAFTGLPLVNGRPYYFAVTAYGYNPLGVPKMYEGALQPITITCEANPAGMRTHSAYGDTIRPTKIGVSDGSALAFVVDPSKVTGHQYRVNFSLDATTNDIVWNVDDITTNVRKLSGQTNQSGDDAYNTVDGIMVKVFGAANDAKGFLEVANANGPHDPTQGSFTFNGSGFPTVLGLPDSTLIPPYDRPAPNAAGARWGIHTGNATGDNTFDFHYENFVARVFRGANFSRFVPYDFEIRFTAAGGMAYLAFTSGSVINVPFELWNIGIGTPNDPSDDYRLIPWVLDANGNEVFDMDSVDHPISGGDNDPETDWIYFYDVDTKTPGTAGYDAFVAAGAGYDAFAGSAGDAITGGEIMARVTLVNFNAGSISDPAWPTNIQADRRLPETGQVFRILATKPNLPGADEYVVNTAGIEATTSESVAKNDINAINVVPNPYLGSNPLERNPLNRFVTFTRLPDNKKSTIRIFTISGVLVRTIEHLPGSTFEQWDLRNRDGIPVASGMYIAHIEIATLGNKVLKFGVIQPDERLDRQ